MMVDTETINGTLAILQEATENLNSTCYWFDEPFESNENYPAHVFEEVEDIYDSTGRSGTVGQTRQVACLLVDKVTSNQTRSEARNHIDALYRELREALKLIEYDNIPYVFRPARMQGPQFWTVEPYEQIGIRIVWETEDVF